MRRRPRCQWRLDIIGRPYCREVWCRDLMAEAKELILGCPWGCPDYHAQIPSLIWEEYPEADTEDQGR